MANTHREWSGSGSVPAAVAGVVTCPSCRTRWRLAQAPRGAPCRCGRCAAVFVPGAVPTAYVVRWADGTEPAAPVRGRGPVIVAARLDDATGDLRVGLDDPSLAARVSRSALNQGGDGPRKPWTWTVKVEDEPLADGPAEAGEPLDAATPLVAPDPPPAPGPEAAAPPAFEIDEPESPSEPAAPVEAEPPPFDVPDPDPVSTEAGPASLREAPLQEPEPSPVDEEDPRMRQSTPVDAAPAGEPEADVPFEAPAADTFAALGMEDVPGLVETAEAETSAESPAADVSAVDDEAPPAVSPEGFEAMHAAAPRRNRPFALRLLVSTLWTAAGAAAGWYAAAWLAASVQPWFDAYLADSGWTVPRDPMFWAGPGAVFGLLLAWGCERWMGRRR